MVRTPRFIWGSWGKLAYNRRATGKGSTFRERKKTKVSFATCGVTVAASYLKSNMERSYGICAPQTRGVDEGGGGTTTYVMPFPKVLKEVRCPVPGCPAVVHRERRLRKHFMFCHFRSKVALFQEGKEPLLRYDLCGMHMPAGKLIRHRRTACCNRNAQMRWRRWGVAINARCSEATFSLTGEEEA